MLLSRASRRNFWVAGQASRSSGPIEHVSLHARMSPETSSYGVHRLLALAWPIVVSRATQVVIGFSDAIMVAPLGEESLAAVTTGSINAFAWFVLPMGTVSIVSSFSSQLFGQNDLSGARRYAHYGLLTALAFGLISVVSIPLLPMLLAAFEYDAEVRSLITTYLQIRLWAAAPFVAMEGLGNYYGGIGNTRLPMKANVLAMVLNVALNWVLIYGHFGAPALGVAGAAWASVISTAVAAAAILVAFLGGVDRTVIAAKRSSGREWLRMLRFGLPNGINWFVEFAAFSFFVNVVVVDLGTTTLAAMMAVIQLNSIAFMPAFGLGSAGAILVGQAIGAARKDDVAPILRRTFAVAAIWMSIVGACYAIAPRLLLAPFNSGNPTFLDVGAVMLVLSSGWQIFDAAGITISEALRAAGDTAFCMWARVSIAWIVFVPMSWLAVKMLGGGAVAAIGSLILYLFVLSIVLFLRFRSGAWRRIILTEPPLLNATTS